MSIGKSTGSSLRNARKDLADQLGRPPRARACPPLPQSKSLRNMRFAARLRAMFAWRSHAYGRASLASRKTLQIKPSDGLEPSTPPYHSAPQREARASAGHADHEGAANQKIRSARVPASGRPCPRWCSLSVSSVFPWWAVGLRRQGRQCDFADSQRLARATGVDRTLMRHGPDGAFERCTTDRCPLACCTSLNRPRAPSELGCRYWPCWPEPRPKARNLPTRSGARDAGA